MKNNRLTSKGAVYGIGMGPGDPELITVKACRILEKTPHIFTASSSDNEYSRAFEILKPYLKGRPVIQLKFLMKRDRELQNGIWLENTMRILTETEKGDDAAFITMGNPLTYSTWGYILKNIRKISPETGVFTIPGITSYNGVSAALNMILTESDESFYLISGLDRDKIENALKIADTIAILKVHKYFDEIYDILEKKGLLDSSVLAVQYAMEGEIIYNNLKHCKGMKLPYFSLIIVKKNGFGQ